MPLPEAIREHVPPVRAHDDEDTYGEAACSGRDVLRRAPPHDQECDVPTPGEDQALVEALAVGLHPHVRSGAAGSHDTSTAQP